MSVRNTKNIAASIKERLRNISKQTGRDFQSIIRQFVQERFLYRLSISSYRENFILKGALLLLTKKVSNLRPTKDIDLLGFSISNQSKKIKEIIYEIISIDTNDGIAFDSIEVEEITQDSDYTGLRIKINARIGNIRDRLHIDICYGDVIVPEPELVDFPTLLDLPKPTIKAYSLESTIAEKFEAIVSLSIVTSRMKDFYDIYFLASNFIFNKIVLKKAILSTFENRNTDLSNRVIIYGKDFIKAKENEWLAFIQRNNLSLNEKFDVILYEIKKFVEPVITENNNQIWNPVVWQWS